MRKMLQQLLTILKAKRGETLFESIVSILVFTILIVTVSMIIAVSLAITSKANTWTQSMQEEANAALIGETALADASAGAVVFIIEDADIEVEIDVTIYESEGYGFVAFEPKQEEP